MQFATRVHVISADGKRINSVPGEAARSQVHGGRSVVVGDPARIVRAIQNVENTPDPCGPCREVTVGSYMGTSYTRRAGICNKAGEVIGYQHELNKLTPLHAELFRQAVIDTTVQL